MKTRKKVAIYIDYTLRVPNFKASFDAFKAELFSDKNFGIDSEDEVKEGDTRFYWKKQMENSEVEKFYMKMKAPEDDYEMRSREMSSFFYNEEHYKMFLDDFSFNLYTDCKVPNSQDIDIVNIAQTQLFEIVMIDEYQSKRKISNTFFFLSKNRLYPQGVMLLNEGQKINEENYLGIWNPKTNKDQLNEQGSKLFLNWFMELEKKEKENE